MLLPHGAAAEVEVLDVLASLVLTAPEEVADLDQGGHELARQIEEAAASIPHRFSGLAEVRHQTRIVIVRLHQVYVPYWRQLSAERLRKWGVPCIDSVKPHDLALVGPRSRIDSLEGRTNYKMAVPDQSALFDGTGSMKAAFLGREDLPGLVRAYAKIGEVTADPAFPVPSIEEAAQTARKRTSFGR